MLVLGIDTSDGVSVALCRGDAVLARAEGADPRRHAETLAPSIEAVLAGAGAAPRDLEAIAVGTGPAPFTGLRVGLVTARALARALGVPAVGVCSLDALARQAFDALGEAAAPGEVLAVGDARRREVYVARYRRHPGDPGRDVLRLDGPAVSTAGAVRAELDAALAAQGLDLASAATSGALAIAGRGAAVYAEHLPPTPGTPGAVDAAVVARLGALRSQRGGETSLEPRYLRRPDVTPAAARKRAS